MARFVKTGGDACTLVDQEVDSKQRPEEATVLVAMPSPLVPHGLVRPSTCSSCSRRWCSWRLISVVNVSACSIIQNVYLHPMLVFDE